MSSMATVWSNAGLIESEAVRERVSLLDIVWESSLMVADSVRVDVPLLETVCDPSVMVTDSVSRVTVPVSDSVSE